MNKEKIKIGFTIGDINGIGPEVLLKSLIPKEQLELFTPVVFGHTRLLGYYKNVLNIQELNYHGVPNALEAVHGKINVVNVLPKTLDFSIGEETEAAGEYARLSLMAATQALEKGEVQVLVTAPVNKNNFHTDNFPYAGHTEYFEKHFRSESLMFMVSEQVRVAVCTHHIPLKEVSGAISKDLVKKRILQLNQSLKEDFGIAKPKIAVLGLNPHAGDGGLLGKEEQEIIQPVVEELFQSGLYCFGPYSADSFFLPEVHSGYDAILAMYHDQGLIPFKTLCFGGGVNYTAGLPVVRVSPDHGVAYDIAGQNIANEDSFKEAIFQGIAIYHSRVNYFEMRENALNTK